LQQLDTTVVRTALERAGISVSIDEVELLGVVCRVSAADARATVAALRDCEIAFNFMIDVFGIDTREAVDVVYHLRSFSRDEEVFVKAEHPYDGVLASIWDLYPAALMPERELCELFGLKLSGHPNPKRLLTTDGCAPYLRKDVAIRTAEEVRNRAAQVVDVKKLTGAFGSIAADPVATPAAEHPLSDGMSALGSQQPPTLPDAVRRAPAGVDHVGTEHLVLSMGPQHPSTHGVLRLSLEIDGEEVVAAEAIIGHLHRGVEKLAESRRFNAVGTLLDRGDYVSGIHNELAFALATEKIMGIEVPRRASWLRVLLGELNRIASHITWYGPVGLDAGAMGNFLYTFRDREALLDILEDITGQRMMFNYVRPGGVVADITTTAEAKIRKFLDDFAIHVEENDEIIMGNEIFQARAMGLGVLSRESALAFGLTGGNLRASGVSWDLRKDRPYSCYDEFDFDVPTSDVGDAYSRISVRVEEMRQSARIIRQCIDGLPEGEHTAKVARVLRPPAGEAYGAVESPRGELGIHLVTDGSDAPYRMRYRPPAMFALQAGETLLGGTLIADSVVLMGTMDIVLGEIDR
jgi:NADH-quinone oxidoreductase subunit D